MRLNACRKVVKSDALDVVERELYYVHRQLSLVCAPDEEQTGFPDALSPSVLALKYALLTRVRHVVSGILEVNQAVGVMIQ